MAHKEVLPPGMTVFERGWLSANNVLFEGRSGTALVDSGYCTHSAQTLALVQHALGPRPLDRLLNTHLHSDHCGGNSALQSQYPKLQTLIPPGQAGFVQAWDAVALTYEPTGQQCPRFRLDGLLEPNEEVELGDRLWRIHAAPGHDPHSVILFEPISRTLISADALWQKGFGVVFPELEGAHAFDDVAATLDLIEGLRPVVVIPGHGAVFGREPGSVEEALAYARNRLSAFKADPLRHAQHAVKVLLKFKLLELQRLPVDDFINWALNTPYVLLVARRYFDGHNVAQWIAALLEDLIRSKAAARSAEFIVNA